MTDQIKKNQVCVLPATTLKETVEEIKDFKEFFKNNLGVEIKYLEQVKTDGGRNDIFFEIVSGMSASFCVSRFQFGIRWIEDVLDNGQVYIKDVSEYRTW